VTEWIFAHETHEVPVHEHEVEGGRVGHEDWRARQLPDQRNLTVHGHRGLLEIGPAGHPRVRMGCGLAAGSVSRLAENVAKSVPSPANAADPRLSIECGPGIGPSVSTSVLT
jgi:hypothetical protein